MAEEVRRTYLGGHEVLTYQNGKLVGIDPFYVAPPPSYQFRADDSSSFLELALPGALFTSGELADSTMTNYYDDVHADIIGSGTNISADITGSTFVEDTGTIKWSSEGYGSSMQVADSGCWGGVLDTDLNFGGSDWVIEGYVHLNENFTKPPFWKVGIRHPNYYLSLDFGNPNPGGNGLARPRIVIDTSTTTQTQHIGSNFTFDAGLATWYHVAWVRSGNNLYVYFDGTQVLSATTSGNIDTNGSLYRILRGENVTNDGLDGNWQDFRIYVGTDLGYNGATITVPSSIIEQI